MRYLEHLPPSELAPWIRCFWTLRGDGAATSPENAAPRRRLVAPDACMDILLHLHDAPADPSGLVVGTMTRPLPVSSPARVDLLGVRFQPGAAAAFLPFPAGELTDGSLELGRAWPGAEGLAEKLTLMPSQAARLEALADVLRRPLASARAATDRTVLEAVRLLDTPRPPAVAEVARRVGLGRRQLARRFQDAVGTPPDVTRRVLRFQAALRSLQAHPERPLARVALESGYHDQAHLTREFRAMAGEPPGAWRLRRRPTP